MTALPYLECPPLAGRAYAAWFTDVSVWRPYVEHVAQRHGLGPPGELSVGVPGSHPVFGTGSCVVKFYAPHWPRNAAAEARTYAALASSPALPVPRLLAEGTLFPEADRWPWPYIAVTRIPGRSVGELRADLSAADLVAMARALAPSVRALHHLQLPEGADRLWTERREALRVQAPARRRAEGGWPQTLLAELPAYLEATCRSSAPLRLVHADITEDHVLLRPATTGWRLAGLIDFADAFVGDAAYDLVPLGLSLFRCDRGALAAFLDAYGPDPAWGEDWRRRATAHLLMFPFGVQQTLADHWPAFSRLRRPRDIEDTFWPPGDGS